jgi:broad specificity phosphatase PhoE
LSKSRIAYFITHADVEIDPAIPVPDWRLSARGRTRHEAFNRRPLVGGIGSVYSSHEAKARDGGEILARHRALPLQLVEALHENDRSATGYLRAREFEQMADAFFANPQSSIRGWERAVDAQARIVKAVGGILAGDRGENDIAIIAHGGVGALLLCHLLGAPISRAHDQPGGGGGHYFSFESATFKLLHGWKRIDEDAPFAAS